MVVLIIDETCTSTLRGKRKRSFFHSGYSLLKERYISIFKDTVLETVIYIVEIELSIFI